MSNPNPPTLTTRPSRWFYGFAMLALIAYAVFIGLHSTVAAGGSDSSGYLNSAKLLASGRLETPVRLPAGFSAPRDAAPSHFQPLGFVAFDDNTRLISTYATGLPLHLALAARLAGWNVGPRLVEIFAAVGAIWLCYAVGRELNLTRALAAAGAVILGASPATLFAALQPLSDLLATTWCLGAVWCALRARRAAVWSIGCGLAFGVAVLVRPTNALLLPALLVLVGLDLRKLALAIAGGLPSALWLAFYNHSVYGGALRSGYFNWTEFFEFRHALGGAVFFLRWLTLFVPAVILILPFVAAARRDMRSRELLALALWFMPITGLYLLVEFAHESWTCLRYLLPAIPALILAALLGVEAMARATETVRAERVRLFAALGLSAWAVGVSWYWSPRNAVFHVRHHEDAYISSALAARVHLPPDAVVLSCHASGALYHYTDFPVLRFDGLSPEHFAQYTALARRVGITIGALLFSAEEQMALRDNCPGEWTLLDTVDGVGVWLLMNALPETDIR